MSVKGTQPARVEGSQAVLKPAVLYPLAWRYCITNGNTVVIQPPAPPAMKALASAGFKPLGRKKLVNAAETQGSPLLGLTPQGAKPCEAEPLPTPNAPPVVA